MSEALLNINTIIHNSINILYSIYIIFSALYINVCINYKINLHEIKNKLRVLIKELGYNPEITKKYLDNVQTQYHKEIKEEENKITDISEIRIGWVIFYGIIWIILIIVNQNSNSKLFFFDSLLCFILFLILYLLILLQIILVFHHIVKHVKIYNKILFYPITVINRISDERKDVAVKMQDDDLEPISTARPQTPPPT